MFVCKFPVRFHPTTTYSRKSAIRVLSVSKPELPISVSEQIDNSFQWSVLLSTIALCLFFSCKSVFGQFTT